MQKKILSISEISEIEQAYQHGVPSLGFAADALLNRWNYNVRDEETALRLIFLRWYSRTEPDWLTGLEDFEAFPEVESIILDFGGENQLCAESLFVIGLLSFDTYAFGMGDEDYWRKKARQYFYQAAEMEIKSNLFTDWKYLTEQTGESTNLKTKIEPEIHARFNGRGYMGFYLVNILSGMVRQNMKASSTRLVPKGTP